MGRLLIGTSGWSYPHWREKFYPKGVASTKWLAFYAQHFDTVELNAAFYRLLKRETFEKWAEQVPEDFLMAVKASRYITHIKQLDHIEGSVQTFLDRVEGLGSRLGPILFQLPPAMDYDERKLRVLLAELPSDFRYAIEFRHKSWFNQDTYDLLEKKGVALCIADSRRYPVVPKLTAPFTYIRFHGGQEIYGSKYTTKELERWAKIIDGYRNQGVDCYIYFNNDAFGYALDNALELRELLNIEAPRRLPGNLEALMPKKRSKVA